MNLTGCAEFAMAGRFGGRSMARRKWFAPRRSEEKERGQTRTSKEAG